MLSKLVGCTALGLLISSFMLFAVSFTVPGRAAPGQLATPAPINLGKVDPGCTIPFEFRVANTTAHVLTLTRLVASCGCTHLDEVEGWKLPPGVSVSIRGILDTSDRRGAMQAHSVLSYRTPIARADQNMILTVEADVRSRFRVRPEPLIFDLDPAKPYSHIGKILIDSTSIDSFLIRQVEASSTWITAEILQPEFRIDRRPAEAASVLVTIDGKARGIGCWSSSDNQQSIRVHTSVESLPVLTIPIHIRCPLKD
jgi:hypothetical protein